jgi:hypothetical protein
MELHVFKRSIGHYQSPKLKQTPRLQYKITVVLPSNRNNIWQYEAE